MPRYLIANRDSGHEFGIYEAASKDDALDVYARDAGYRDFEDCCSITLTGPTPEQIADEVERVRSQLHVSEVE